MVDWYTMLMEGGDVAPMMAPGASLAIIDPYAFIKENEGFKDTAYPDAGGMSIGYGTSLNVKTKPNIASQLQALGYDIGKLVSGEQKITEQEAEALMKASMGDFEGLVARRFGPDLSPNKMAALVDLAYQSWDKYITPDLVKAVQSGDDETAARILSTSYTSPALRGRAEKRASLFRPVSQANAAEPPTQESSGGRDWYGALTGETTEAPKESAPKESPGWFRQVDNFVRALATGATFGTMDEIAAYANSLIGSGEYQANLETERQRDKEAAEENPILTTTGEIGGSVLGTIGAGKVLGAIPGVARTFSALPRVAQYATTGGVTGAASGFGHAEGEQRIPSAVVGGTAGAAIGAVVPTAIDVMKWGAGKIGNYLGPRIAPKSAAARKLAENVARDDMTARQIESRLQRLGPRATITDAGGPNVRLLGESIANEPGLANRMATRVMEPRAATQGQRILDAARRGLGVEGNFYGRINDLIEDRGNEASQLYAAAYAKGPVFSETLAALSKRPSLQAALPHAVKIAQERGLDPTELVGLAIEKDGAVRLVAPRAGALVKEGTAAVRGPTAQTWDYIKRGLDKVVEEHRNQVTGKLNLSDPWVYSVNQTREMLVNELKHLNPEYKTALNAFAGHSALLDAARRGRMFARGDEEVTAAIVKKLSPSEREFFREGVLREMQTMIDRGADGINKARQFIAVPRMRAALEAAFPDHKSFREFSKTLIAENRMAITKNAVLRGSQTARRLAGQEDAANVPAGIASQIAHGDAPGAVAQAMANLMNRWREMPQAQKDALARMLFSTDPAEQQRALRAISPSPVRLQANQVINALFGTGLAGAIGEQSGALAAGQ